MPKTGGGKQAKRLQAAWAIRCEDIDSSRRPMTAEEASDFLAGIRKGKQVLCIMHTLWSTHAQEAETICRWTFIYRAPAWSAPLLAQLPTT